LAEGTISLLGKPVKKNTVYALGAVGLGVIVIAVYRSRKAKTAAATSPSSGAVDPNSLDPAGYPIGSAADVAWQQSQGGAGYSGGGGVAYPVTPTGTGSGAVPSFPDNASWAQYVEAYLVDQLSADAQVTGNALGKYITGQPVLPAQQSIIQQAIAFAGNPPVAGASGMPPSINLAAAHHPPPPPDPRDLVKRHVVVADGTDTLQAMAQKAGVTEAEVAHANPQLARTYEGTGHPVRKGTHVLIPEHTVKS
jgi:hypothetical protein